MGYLVLLFCVFKILPSLYCWSIFPPLTLSWTFLSFLPHGSKSLFTPDLESWLPASKDRRNGKRCVDSMEADLLSKKNRWGSCFPASASIGLNANGFEWVKVEKNSSVLSHVGVVLHWDWSRRSHVSVSFSSNTETHPWWSGLGPCGLWERG